MDDLADPESPSPPNRLAGWKAIAAYLGVSQRTAIRWAETASMPVRRVTRVNRPSVVADPSELDAWYVSPAAARARGEDVPAPAEDGPSESTASTEGGSPAGVCDEPATAGRSRHVSLALVALGLFLFVGLAFGLHRLVSPSESAVPRDVAPTGSAGRAAGRSLSLDRVVLRLGFGDQPESTVTAKPGDMIRVETPSIWLGIQTRPDEAGLTVVVSEIESLPDGEAVRYRLTRTLERDHPERLEVKGQVLIATWIALEHHPGAIRRGLTLEPCCMLCRGINFCGEAVESTCGACEGLERKAPDNVRGRDQSGR
jgi:hypothetical protein